MKEKIIIDRNEQQQQQQQHNAEMKNDQKLAFIFDVFFSLSNWETHVKNFKAEKKYWIFWFMMLSHCVLYAPYEHGKEQERNYMERPWQ